MEKDNGIDKLFRDGLNDPEIPFKELDWAKMEQKLDAKAKKRIVPFWLVASSGIAAALIVGLFWYFSGSEKIVKEPKKVEIVESKKEKPVNNKPLVTNTDTSTVVKTNPEAVVVEPGIELPVKQMDQEYVKTPKVINRDQDLINTPDTSSVKEDKKQELIAKAVSPKTEDKQTVAPIDSLLPDKKSEVLVHNNEPATKITGKRSALTLSIMAAPDISSSNLNVDTKISSNIGVLATYAITDKISVTTGAVYSRKLYNYGGVGSAGTAYMKNAWQVNADCIVLDVPLNVNYTFLKRRNFSVGVNSGLSSYFMLNEKYKYITGPQGGTQKVTELEIKNQNQHIFGVANLSLSFERRITNSLSFGVQPFIKLPLTGIGNGNARLKSTGIAFSLNLGLFPKSGRK
ncbi:hypothetical protein CPT03_13185 [Pedobacter ginsengisoli]|uniref:Outer membrane protein beta-barrel domain-containing protein n=1 Tax=Pedobacter ginsengisoli TaxID=363852 RepID=A0A2D1U6Y1_9SPHI|nr:hypothetical protein [Pedobacter ginsengisoli]ATP57358.1 hypothetical protein CPT03_13185 [Pedobacter ginsengisoli]